MSLRIYPYFCADCGEPQDIMVEYEQRDEPQECPICGQECPRTWTGMTVAVSTEKMSATMPEAAGRGRFDGLRRKQELKKEKSDARQRGDSVSEKKIDKELKR